VKAAVRDLRASLGHRVANIFDLNERTYLFKFAIPGVPEKPILLMESGIRFHLTKFTRDKSDMPSPFAMKLRKYLRTKRLESVAQLGTDRVVDFKFGSGESANHIILELYASGNIVLTDMNYMIIAVVRSHDFGDESEAKIAVGEIYPFTQATGLGASGAEEDDTERTRLVTPVVDMDAVTFRQWALERVADWDARAAAAATISGADSGKKSGKKRGKKKHRPLALRQMLLSPCGGLQSMGVEVIDHICWSTSAAAALVTADSVKTDSPLVVACRDGDDAAVEKLLASGSDVNAAGLRGLTPLMWAVRRGHEDLAVSLCERHGANVHAKCDVGSTALDYNMNMELRTVLKQRGLKDFLKLPECPPGEGAVVDGTGKMEASLTAPSRTVVDVLASCSDEILTVLIEALKKDGPRLMQELDAPGQPGYILLQEKEKDMEKERNEGEKALQGDFTEFMPALYAQHSGRPYRQFPSFMEAVDTYFSSVEDQKLHRQTAQAQEQARGKVAKFYRDQQSTLLELEQQEERAETAARLVQQHAEDVDKVLLVIKSNLNAGTEVKP